MRLTSFLFSAAIVFLIVKAVEVAGRIDRPPGAPPEISADQDLTSAVTRLNAEFRRLWDANGVSPAEPADDLTVLRRLSLALFGTIPSLEEIRAFQADTAPDRLNRWTSAMLKDSRFADYFSERLARSLVGVDGGPFIIYRRDRLKSWLATQLRSDAPWSGITEQLIAAEGLWTDSPASNFITVARTDNEVIDVNALAGRTVRTFLGQRIDCAQCHDHPFDPEWKQQDFEGLAAFFCQASVTIGGVTDRPLDGNRQKVVYRVLDPGGEPEDARDVPEAVPFNSEWLPENGGLRHRLAGWVTHPENRRYERAISNRIWGFMLGKPYHEPVDDLPHPEADQQDVLDILGQEFRSRGDRLSVLIRLIAGSDVFRLSSQSDVSDESEWNNRVATWSVFPLIRLRPEQVIGSLFQAGHIRTIDQKSSLIVRVQKFGNENDFLNEYGDMGDDELTQQVGTIPQALLRMNGRFTRELSKVDFLSATSQLLTFSPDNESLIDNCFLACLTRLPSSEEKQYFLARLEKPPEQVTENFDASPPLQPREAVVQDLYWVLFNSPEFSWNH